MNVPAGVPAGYLYTDEMVQVLDVICDLPVDADEWRVLKLAILRAWPRDPWAHQWDAPSQGDTPTSDTDDLSEEETGD